MKTFKVGDIVRTTGYTAGNGHVERGTVYSVGTSVGVTAEDGRSWTVRTKDLELVNDDAAIAFAGRFLTKQGAKLFKEGYLEVRISASDKMKAEMEVEAVENFIKKFK